MKPLALIILDGFGINPETRGNAIKAAHMPNYRSCLENNPHTSLEACGLAVGLPKGQMGNSEVGHTNIGAGRIVYQELTRIDKNIQDGSFFENKEFIKAMDSCNNLHIMGLFSPGGVHSHLNHILALLEMAEKRNVKRVYLHAFTDGRDCPPSSGRSFLEEALAKCKKSGNCSIATVSGRFYAMDRDKRYDRVKKAYDAISSGLGIKTDDFLSSMEESYKNGVLDEFIVPMVKSDYNGIEENDAVIFANFRPDRAREITRALTGDNFDGFPIKDLHLSSFVTMTSYDATLSKVNIAYPPTSLNNILAEVLEKNNKTQLRIAETEKYAHVTFFFNGGSEEPQEHERRILIPSPKVATYDMQPEMSAYEVTDSLLKVLDEDCPDVIILNFANCDMVGHTGVFDAAKQACEAVDICLGKLIPKIKEMGGISLITADHGNADVMIDENGEPMTAHSLNPVPFVTVGLKQRLREGGVLADIAPTMLDILGIEKPKEMTGTSLLIK